MMNPNNPSENTAREMSEFAKMNELVVSRCPISLANASPLVMTSGYDCDPRTGKQLGSAGYSYAFVARQYLDVLQNAGEFQFESSRGVDHNQQAAGHIGFRALHDFEFAEGIPNIAVPAWEFPEVPNDSFGVDHRHNWVSQADRCDHLIHLCEFTAEAFKRAGVSTPYTVIPVPVSRDYFAIADWKSTSVVTLQTPAIILGPRQAVSATSLQPRTSAGILTWIKRQCRAGYRDWIRPRIPRWIELGITAGIKEAARQKQLLATTTESHQESVELSGVVFTTVFNPLDKRKNWEDLLSAFLLSVGDHPDATLVIKLVGNDPAALNEVLAHYRRLDLFHQARIVILTGYLSDQQMADLTEATSWYVTATRAEGACLPLMQWLAAGRPAVSPCHTAIADYFSPAVGLVVDSNAEPCVWPHDPQQRCRTTWQRINWSSLRDQIAHAYQLATRQQDDYQVLSCAAREMSLKKHHPDVVSGALCAVFKRVFTEFEGHSSSAHDDTSRGNERDSVQLLPNNVAGEPIRSLRPYDREAA